MAPKGTYSETQDVFDSSRPPLSKEASTASTAASEPRKEQKKCEGSEASSQLSRYGKIIARPYNPPPAISQTSILVVGALLFVLAQIWTPLILFVAYGASILIPYSFRINDEASVRRILYEDFKQETYLPLEFRETPKDIAMEEKYWVNKRGMCLLTAIMSPATKPIEAVTCFTHGFTDHCSFMKRVEHYRLVRKGIAVVYVEIEGHGRSDGPLGLIKDWNTMAGDVADFFEEVYHTRFQGKRFFLMGESMGGAVAYTVYNMIPDMFQGVVFQSPMCKISEELMPPRIVVKILRRLIDPQSITSFLGYLPLAPTESDLEELMGKNRESLAMSESAPTMYCRKPRLATGATLLDVTSRISNSIFEFDAPFLVQHGSDDKVTDPRLSQALYDESKSKDKTIRLYEGMWHSLTHGEPEENKDLVFNDAIEWILERC